MTIRRGTAVREGERSHQREPEPGLESAARFMKSAHTSILLDRAAARRRRADAPHLPYRRNQLQQRCWGLG
jgi:hypothetical protein